MYVLRRVRLPLPGASGVTSYYMLTGVLLTLVWLALRGLAPTGGLTRSFHYPLGPGDQPAPAQNCRNPAAEERAVDVALAFLDELRRVDLQRLGTRLEPPNGFWSGRSNVRGRRAATPR